MKYIDREFTRFIVVGGINTISGYVVYALLLFILPYTISYTISYVLGILISYYLNSRFVFKSKLSLSKAVQYPLVYVFQYISGVLLLRLLVEVFRVNTLIAPVVVIALTIPMTYFLSRFILKGYRQ